MSAARVGMAGAASNAITSATGNGSTNGLPPAGIGGTPPVRMPAADGKQTTGDVRQTTGRLTDVPSDGRGFFSKRHPREKSQAYCMGTDRTRSAQQAVQGYGGRWSCEGDTFSLKTPLGLADFRGQSSEAVDRYLVGVRFPWAYIERRFAQERSAQSTWYGDVIRRHRDEHTREWWTSALPMVLETGAIAPGLERFLREAA